MKRRSSEGLNIIISIMVLSLFVSLVLKLIKLEFESYENPHWTEEDLEVFVHLWLVILSV
jgi:hypothetical protein